MIELVTFPDTTHLNHSPQSSSYHNQLGMTRRDEVHPLQLELKAETRKFKRS